MTEELWYWAENLQHEAPEFRDLGRSHSAVDCWGVVCLAYAELLHVQLPWYDEDYESIKQQPDRLKQLFLSGHRDWVEIPAEQAGPFDLVNLRLRSRPIHVGLILKPGWMIHALEKSGVSIEQYTGPLWADRHVGFFRHPSRA